MLFRRRPVASRYGTPTLPDPAGARGPRWLTSVGRDLRHSWRRFTSTPLASSLTAGILAVGIGTNVTLSGALRHVLLAPPPGVDRPDNVMRVLRTGMKDGARTYSDGANYPVLSALRGVSSITNIAGYAERSMSMGHGADAVPVRAALVTNEYFRMLGAPAMLGQTFDSGAVAPVVVLSNSLWRRSFGSDSAIVGKPLRIGQRTYSVAAVMPAGFRGTTAQAPDLWLPVSLAAADPEAGIDLDDPMRYALVILVRLRDGADRVRAEHDMSVVWNATSGAGQTRAQAVVLAPVTQARGPDAPQEVRVAEWLMIASALILFLTCGNAANILLGRALTRRHELELRMTLGASRAGIAQQLVVEAALFATIGLAGASVIAALAGPIVLRAVTGLDAPARFMDWSVVAYAAVVALGTGALVGLAPLWVLRHVEHGQFRSGPGLATRPAVRAQHALLLVQCALCMSMLMVAALFGLSLRRALAVDLGIDASRTIRAVVNLDRMAMSRESLDALYAELMTRLTAAPGVEGVALAGTDPYQGGRAVAPYTSEHDADYFWPPTSNQVPMEAAVGPGFFSAVGARTLRGRDFTTGDTRSAPRVAIINEPLANRLFGPADAIGRCIYAQSGDPAASGCMTVVGVLGGVWYFTMTDRTRPMLYVPLDQRVGFAGYSRPQGWFIRVAGRPEASVNTIRRITQSIGAEVPPARVTLLQDVIDGETRPWRVGATLFGMFAAAAALVALLGLYSVVAFAAIRQTRAVAIRVALGAQKLDVLRAVAGPAIGAISAGLVAGAAIGFWIAIRVTPLLFQTRPSDPKVVLYPLGVMLVISILAIAGPPVRAWRAPVSQVLRES